MDFKITIEQNGQKFNTLADILPEAGNLKILFIAKTPATKSVDAGHYFQGQQGTMFWNKLQEYKLLQVKDGTFADENLTEHRYGITDIVKLPRDFGNEPSKEEYQFGLTRILSLIKKHQPEVIVFVYKRVLDNILKWGHGVKTKSNYGFNHQLEKYFGSKVFVFPMPGTPCTTQIAIKSMTELMQLFNQPLN